MDKDIPDVDIDVGDREAAVKLFEDRATSASQLVNESFAKHNVGIYLQRIPVNPLTGWSSFDFRHAESLGYYKVDVIANSIYRDIQSQEQLQQIIDEPIEWEWFEHPEFVALLFQLGNEAEIVAAYAPKSIADLAALVAIIRPGKRYLIGEPWETIREKIWQKETGKGQTFKKSHAIAYALAVVVDAKMKAKHLMEKLDE